MTPAHWGWIVASVETASWAISRVRGSWSDDVPVEIRTAAAEVSDRLEQIGRYVRGRMERAR